MVATLPEPLLRNTGGVNGAILAPNYGSGSRFEFCFSSLEWFNFGYGPRAAGDRWGRARNESKLE